jgi:hypothetical protein
MAQAIQPGASAVGQPGGQQGPVDPPARQAAAAPSAQAAQAPANSQAAQQAPAGTTTAPSQWATAPPAGHSAGSGVVPTGAAGAQPAATALPAGSGPATQAGMTGAQAGAPLAAAEGRHAADPALARTGSPGPGGEGRALPQDRGVPQPALPPAGTAAAPAQASQAQQAAQLGAAALFADPVIQQLVSGDAGGRSFAGAVILNAAMIPGWPFPKPIEGAPASAQAARTGARGQQEAAAEVDPDTMAMHVAKFAAAKAALRNLFAAEAADPKRRKGLMDLLKGLVDTFTEALDVARHAERFYRELMEQERDKLPRRERFPI